MRQEKRNRSAPRVTIMPWTAEQKRDKRRRDAIAKGKTPRIRLQKGKSMELKLENVVSSNAEKTMQEDLETARMQSEDLRQHLMDIGARVDAARLANVRQRMLPGTRVRLKKEWTAPLSLSPADGRHTMILRKRTAQHCWDVECVTGPNKGRIFWCALPDCAFEFA